MQAFYTTVELHATSESEDKCPKQKLDYDRTNLLKNHEPQAKFTVLLSFIAITVRTMIPMSKAFYGKPKNFQREQQNLFAFVQNHSNLNSYRHLKGFFLGWFPASFHYCLLCSISLIFVAGKWPKMARLFLVFFGRSFHRLKNLFYKILNAV